MRKGRRERIEKGSREGIEKETKRQFEEKEGLRDPPLLQRFTAESSRELSALRKLNNKQRQVSMFLILLFKLLTQLPFVSFFFSLLPFSILSFNL